MDGKRLRVLSSLLVLGSWSWSLSFFIFPRGRRWRGEGGGDVSKNDENDTEAGVSERQPAAFLLSSFSRSSSRLGLPGM